MSYWRHTMKEKTLKRIVALLLLLALPALLVAQPLPSPQSKPLALTHVTVIDATGPIRNVCGDSRWSDHRAWFNKESPCPERRTGW